MSSPSPFGQNISLNNANNNISQSLVAANDELQWSEGYYRGYFELHINKDWANASFFGMPTIINRNSFEIPLANFSVASGANHLQRPVAGGTVESGALAAGSVVMTNLTNDTSVAGGSWFVSHDDEEDI